MMPELTVPPPEPPPPPRRRADLLLSVVIVLVLGGLLAIQAQIGRSEVVRRRNTDKALRQLDEIQAFLRADDEWKRRMLRQRVEAQDVLNAKLDLILERQQEEKAP